MYTTLIALFASFLVGALACNPGTPGCDHPGNFTGTLTAFKNPESAYCMSGNQTSIFANVPASLYNPPDESPCNAPINITHPTTKKTISAVVIGECKACKGENIQLTTAGLVALSPNGKVDRAPMRVKWTFDTSDAEVEEEL